MDNSRDNLPNNNANNNIPQFDGPSDSPLPQTKVKVETDIILSQDSDDKERESDNSFEQDTEVDDVDHHELQHLCFGLDDYASESEASLTQKNQEKTARLAERLRAAQQSKNDQRRTYRERCLRASTIRVPPQLLDHRVIDWEEYLRSWLTCLLLAGPSLRHDCPRPHG